MAEIPQNVQMLLDDSMEAKLFDSATVGDATYYVIDQYDEDSGEMVIVQVRGNAPPTIVEGIPEEDQTVGGAAVEFSPELRERLRAYIGEPVDGPGDADVGGAPPLDQESINILFHNKAVNYTGVPDPAKRLSSANAPGTDGGNLACAWAVNRVSKDGLGRQVGGGLATAEMIKVLQIKHKLIADPAPGCIVISPTVTRMVDGRPKRNIGHVGIVGVINETDSDLTRIFSNSSSAAEFQDNFWIEKWRNKYKVDKGLEMLFFVLSPREFPEAGASS